MTLVKKIENRTLRLKIDYSLVGGSKKEIEIRLWELYNLLYGEQEADKRCRLDE